jgi:hypothetical protein
MQVLHGGDARADHLEGRVERIQVQVDVARHHARGEPQLERLVE